MNESVHEKLKSIHMILNYTTNNPREERRIKVKCSLLLTVHGIQLTCAHDPLMS